MKIYISADVEGLNGITNFKQVLPEFEFEYHNMQIQLHKELNALIKGLIDAGVDEIVVNDAHNTMTNIVMTELPDNVVLISGKPKSISMMHGLDNTFDGVIFFAYHAKATTDATLAHTFNMFFDSVKINGESVSEAQLNAIYAAQIGVPILLASGDNIFCDEIQNDLGNITTITTKQAISRTAAICRKNADLLQEYYTQGSKIKILQPVHYKTKDNYCIEISVDGKIYKDNFSDFPSLYLYLQKISAETTLRKNQILPV